MRVAEALHNEGHNVLVEQRGREADDRIYTNAISNNPEAVIILRLPHLLQPTRIRFPKAKIYLWMHDWATRDLALSFPELAETRTTILGVSEHHKTQIAMTLAPVGDLTKVPIRRIYNPIEDSLNTNGQIIYDGNKLVFFSSPHKGLDNTLKIFSNLRSFLPDARLYVSNPGYYKSHGGLPTDGSVVNLGILTHAEAIAHVRSSLCVFYPNYVFPETFGLVFAEANAVGTPVLTHPCGAATEVMKEKRQFVDGRNPKEVIDRVVHWHKDAGNRPVVEADERFRMSTITKEWEKLLNEHNT